jgi:hypothetical protein
MAGEDLTQARVTYAGLTGDRVYALIDTQNQSDFPWMTGRQGRELLLFRPRFLTPPPETEDHPTAEHYETEVTSPEGQTFRISEPALREHLEKRFKKSLRLRFSERSMTDSKPVSILGLATVRGLSDETGIELDPRRFRANFYVHWDQDVPFHEDKLVGRELRIGEAITLRVVVKDSRCIMITLDPETAKPAPPVLERVARNHAGCTGVYAAVLQEGIVRVDDPVYLV